MELFIAQVWQNIVYELSREASAIGELHAVNLARAIDELYREMYPVENI